MFKKILIANRGEIACRIIRTAREMGILTVAVYSDADRSAQHVLQADEAVYLGPAPSSESYLRIDKILAAAHQTGAEAIHPGYGFLAENESFAEQIEQAGLVFIGPPASAIAAMGSKSAAKNIMDEAGVPLVPGYHGEQQDTDFLKAEAHKIGYPVLLKAAYGGGGKGMRIVENDAEFDEALSSAQREAKAAFGNDKMLVEKYIQQPRHVEIQVFCDAHGQAVYLAERDCSVQRRHQKVIEEAPAPGLSEATRKAMGEAAVRAAQAINYVGAGTVEFLYDKSGDFYFMEMNTRLQVEHPITEMILGVDLVQWQLLVAAKHPLPLAQDDIQIKGHAFEARIYAENPDDNFMPSTGVLEHLKFPTASKQVRIDTGVTQGDSVSTYYDPMIAKLIVWGANRPEALARLEQALQKTYITGLSTNTEYLLRLAQHPAFQAEEISTHFIDDHKDSLQSKQDSALKNQQLAIMAACIARASTLARPSKMIQSPWQCTQGWLLNAPAQNTVRLVLGEEQHNLDVIQDSDAPNQYLIQPLGIELLLTRGSREHHLRIELNGTQQEVCFLSHTQGYSLFSAQGRLDAALYQVETELTQEADQGALTAPMNGTVVAVLVEQGAKVKEGDALVVMEAMKMEYTIRAPFEAEVSQVFFQTGELVNDGAELVSLQQIEKDAGSQ